MKVKDIGIKKDLGEVHVQAWLVTGLHVHHTRQVPARQMCPGLCLLRQDTSFLTEPVGVGAAVTYVKSMLHFQVWVKKWSLWVGGVVFEIKWLTDWRVTQEASISGEKARFVRGEMKSSLGTVFPTDSADAGLGGT